MGRKVMKKLAKDIKKECETCECDVCKYHYPCSQLDKTPMDCTVREIKNDIRYNDVFGIAINAMKLS